jgi:hypothetical protein
LRKVVIRLRRRMRAKMNKEVRRWKISFAVFPCYCFSLLGS